MLAIYFGLTKNALFMQMCPLKRYASWHMRTYHWQRQVKQFHQTHAKFFLNSEVKLTLFSPFASIYYFGLHPFIREQSNPASLRSILLWLHSNKPKHFDQKH